MPPKDQGGGTPTKSKAKLVIPEGNDGEQRAVLLGPKEPLWTYKSCSCTTNWASRVWCNCGERQPTNKLRKAIARHREAVAAAGDRSAQAEQPRGPKARGP